MSGDAEAGQVGRVDHQDRVELVPDAGPRLHVAHAGQQQRRQRRRGSVSPFWIRAATSSSSRVARRLLQQPDEGLDLGLEAHDLRVQRRLGGRDRPEPGQEAQVAQAHQRAARRGRLQETPSIRSDAHGCSSLQDQSCRSKTGLPPKTVVRRARGGPTPVRHNHTYYNR